MRQEKLPIGFLLMSEIDLQGKRNIHLVGIGGCGMSGLAKVLKEMGFNVSGSDIKEGPNTLRLRDLGVKVFIGHHQDQVRGADLVVYSSAISADNPELREAQEERIPMMMRAELLSWIMNQSKNKIAIAGTHGKTTTTAMIAKVFDFAQLKPTYFIGCDMDYIEGNARLGNGNFSVAEADESDRSFLFLSPTVEVITNVEADHLEHFGSMEELFATFEEFLRKISSDGFLVIEGTDPNLEYLRKKSDVSVITYGFGASCNYSAKDFVFAQNSSSYLLLKDNQILGKVELLVPGRQNILNSLAVFAVSLEFGLDFSVVAAGLRSFVGARRRFSLVGQYQNIMIVDDYAHHPTEIKETLLAAHLGWPQRRIIAIFQPHRFTRTMLLKDQFASAFDRADLVVITDIYAASEDPILGISGQTIADLLDPKKTIYQPRKELIAQQLVKELKEGDLVLTLGAGDIYTVGKELLACLKMQ
ncbi:MAG: UDP-N-acetylmuramate--L-alanine ligase [Candidatus Margulisiibacteriota bacterium]